MLLVAILALALQDEDRCEKVLVSNISLEQTTESFSEDLTSFAEAEFEEVHNEYQTKSKGGKLGAVVKKIPISAGFSKSELRTMWEGIREYSLQFKSSSIDHREFAYRAASFIRPDQVDAWLECIKLEHLSLLSFRVRKESDDRAIGESHYTVSVVFDPTRVRGDVVPPRILRVSNSESIEGDDGELLKGFSVWKDATLPVRLQASGSYTVKEGRVGFVTVIFENYDSLLIPVGIQRVETQERLSVAGLVQSYTESPDERTRYRTLRIRFNEVVRPRDFIGGSVRIYYPEGGHPTRDDHGIIGDIYDLAPEVDSGDLVASFVMNTLPVRSNPNYSNIKRSIERKRQSTKYELQLLFSGGRTIRGDFTAERE